MYSDPVFNSPFGDSQSKEVERLFSKSLIVSIAEGNSAINRKSKLNITIERPYGHHLRKDLNIRITDDIDPFLIYSLCITEDDYQSLKSQQGLLIDFLAFPQKFIGLLELCLQEEYKDTPKFGVTLHCSTRLGCDSAIVQLDIVEANPFKYLTHLSLKLTPAPDSFVKTYLASCLKSLKEENDKLESCLRGTQNDFQSRLHQCQDSLNARNKELELVRQQLQGEISGLSRRHSDDLRLEQNKIMMIHQEAEMRWEKEKNEIESKNRKEVQQLQSKLDILESQNKDYQEKILKAESSVRDLRSRFVNSEEELQQYKQKNHTLSKENHSLDSQFHEHLKSLGTLKLKLNNLELDLKEKEHVLNKSQEMLQSVQDQKRQLESLMEQKSASLTKRETAIRTLSEELNKGNDIIRKLQTELKNYHAKLQLRSQITTKQEEAVEAKDAEIKHLKERLTESESALKEKDSKVSTLTSDVDTLKQSLEESLKQVKSNENIISWLNKQLNEAGGYKSTLHSIPLPSSVPYRTPMTSTPGIVPCNGFSAVKQVLQPLGNRIPQQLPQQTGQWSQTPITTGVRIGSTGYGHRDTNFRNGIDPKYFEKNSENHEPGPSVPPSQSVPSHVSNAQRRSMDNPKGGKPSAAKAVSRASLGTRKTAPK